MHSHNMLHEGRYELPGVEVLFARYKPAYTRQGINDDAYRIISV